MTKSACQQMMQRNEFKLIGIYFRNLWNNGRLLANLWSYWTVSVIIIGGIGVWVSIVLECSDVQPPNVLLSLITFSPPIAATACLEFIFLSDKEWFLKGPAILVGCVVGMIAVLSVLLMKHCLWLAYLFAGLGVVFAYILSWFACARDPKFQEGGDYSAPLGGSMAKDVEGSEKGFTL